MSFEGRGFGETESLSKIAHLSRLFTTGSFFDGDGRSNSETVAGLPAVCAIGEMEGVATVRCVGHCDGTALGRGATAGSNDLAEP